MTNWNLNDENTPFNHFNTEGYSDEQLNDVNDKWAEVVEAENLERYTDEYNQRFDEFSIDSVV